MPAQNALFLLKLLGVACTGQECHRGCQAPSPAPLRDAKMQPLPGAGRPAALPRRFTSRLDPAAAASAGRDAHPPSFGPERIISVLCCLLKITGQGPFPLGARLAGSSGPQQGRCLQATRTALLMLAVHQWMLQLHLSGFNPNNRPSPLSCMLSRFFASIQQF